MQPRIKRIYIVQVIPYIRIKFNYCNLYQVPHIKKIVINRGIGSDRNNIKILDFILKELTIISAQRCFVTRSKKAISGFKLRKNAPVGISVTLRGERIYAFLDRLINLALPRIRDFQGVDLKGFDGYGNYGFGLEDQLIFPEIQYEKVNHIQGIDIIISIIALTNHESIELLKRIGIPFCK